MIAIGVLVVIALVVVAAARWMDDAGGDDRRYRELRERLDDWSRAGLISASQAARITTFEIERERPMTRGAGTDRRGAAAEAVGYVGAALAVGALALLLSDLWQQLVVGGRLALVGLLTALVGSGGLVLHRSDRDPMQRLAGVLLATTVIGAGWLALLVGLDVTDLEGEDAALLVGGVAALVALPLYVLRRRAMAQLALYVPVLVIIGALLAQPSLDVAPVWIGLVFWGFGAAWLLLGLGGWLRPATVAEMLGATAALLAAQFASFDDARAWLLWLGLATALALVGLGVAADRLHDLALGAVGLFVFVPQLVFELFGDAIGAPATLLVVGLLLVLLAVGLGRVRREVGS